MLLRTTFLAPGYDGIINVSRESTTLPLANCGTNIEIAKTTLNERGSVAGLEEMEVADPVPSNADQTRSQTGVYTSMFEEQDAPWHPKGCKGSVAGDKTKEAVAKLRSLNASKRRSRRKVAVSVSTKSRSDTLVFDAVSGFADGAVPGGSETKKEVKR